MLSEVSQWCSLPFFNYFSQVILQAPGQMPALPCAGPFVKVELHSLKINQETQKARGAALCVAIPAQRDTVAGWCGEV